MLSEQNKFRCPYFSFLILLLGFLSSKTLIYPQAYDPERLENIFEKISEETNIIPDYDQFEKLVEDPIVLRTANIDELNKIPGFNLHDAKTIIKYIRSHDTLTYSGIYSEANLEPDEQYLFGLCTRLDSSFYLSRKFDFSYRTRANEQLHTANGYSSGVYSGNPLNFYNRASIEQKGFAVNIITDKDAGELPYVDFYSFNISGEIADTKFIIGDFNVQSGMGSILWGAFGSGKGPEVISPAIQFGSGINVNRSSYEYGFFRGGALQNNFKINNDLSLRSSLWASSTYRSATLDSSGNTVTSLYNSGYYRTSTEIMKKNVLKEANLGVTLELKSSIFNLGFTMFNLKYDKPVESNAKNTLNGKEGLLSSVYTFINLENIFFGGELSRDAQGSMGIKSAVMLPTINYDAVMSFRYFPSSFRSPFGSNFGENSIPNNETGIYLGLNYKSINNINLSFYADFFKNIDSTYTLPTAGKGIDLLSEIDWQFLSNTEFRGKLEYKEQTDLLTGTNVLYQKKHYKARLEIKNNYNSNITLRSRVEASFASFSGYKDYETGIAGYLDVKYKIFEFLSINGRLSYFSTDSYETAIWQYELALPGYFTTTAMYGEGMRFYLNLGVGIMKHLNLNLRYSVTSKNNITAIGSGNTEIPGNNDERIYIQLDL